MARQYPRFLFSDPQNTKTTGPFIVHNLTPRAIFRVNEKHEVLLIEAFEYMSKTTEAELVEQTQHWYNYSGNRP